MCGLLVALVLLVALAVASVWWAKRGIERDIAAQAARIEAEFRDWAEANRQEQADWSRQQTERS